MKLPSEYYLHSDVVWLARDLLGKVICTEIDGHRAAGIITETEAYAGETDKASHAYGGRRTPRTETMYAQGGCAYVYLCYGIHHLFNVVSNCEGIPHAVLLRGIRPVEGEAVILKRRNKQKLDQKIAAGPGTLTQALGIKTYHDLTDLTGNTIWIEDRGIQIPNSNIKTGKRIGIDYAEEDKDLPYRFRAKIS